MASPSISSICVKGLHGRRDSFSVKFFEGLNIVHGRNGTGKTTLLHIIANLLERDIQRFCFLNFREIIVETHSGCVIKLEQAGKGRTRFIVVYINGVAMDPIPKDMTTPPALAAALAPHLGGRPVYLPAFRTMLEGTMRGGERHQYVNSEEAREQFERIKKSEAESSKPGRRYRYAYWTDPFESVATKTVVCRQWFGSFVPVIRYPSLMDLAADIASEYQNAVVSLSMFDQEALSSVFVKVFHSAFGTGDYLGNRTISESFQRLKDILPGLEDSPSNTPAAYRQIADFLQQPIPQFPPENERLIRNIAEIYAQTASDRLDQQRAAFNVLNGFMASVNRLFGKTKNLVIDGAVSHRIPDSGMLQFEDGTRHSLNVLSSGERHLMTLLFCATHMSDTDGIVLIDEPELSLHIDWQRIILGELQQQAGDRQLIVCTHASEVAADHRSSLVSFEAVPENTEFEFSGEELLLEEENLLE